MRDVEQQPCPIYKDKLVWIEIQFESLLVSAGLLADVSTKKMRRR